MLTGSGTTSRYYERVILSEWQVVKYLASFLVLRRSRILGNTKYSPALSCRTIKCWRIPFGVHDREVRGLLYYCTLNACFVSHSRTLVLARLAMAQAPLVSTCADVVAYTWAASFYPRPSL